MTFTTDRKTGFQEEELVQQMMGKTYSFQKPAVKERTDKRTVMQVRDLTVTDDRGREVLRNVNLTVHEGEIIGIAGISGNGQREMMETLFGLRKPKQGQLFFGDKEMTSLPTSVYIDAGVAYIPENPNKESIVPGFTVLEHMVLNGTPVVPKGWGIDWQNVRERLAGYVQIGALGVAAPERIASQLSGGNVQRLVLARAIVRDPALLLVSYPSRGLDLGTIHSVHERLFELRDKGTSIVVLSEDLNELFRLSDRIVVVGNRTVQGPFDPAQTDPYRIGHVMLEGVAT